MDSAAKLEQLQAALRGLGRVAIGFSGGVDSTFLVRVARDTLGPQNVLAVIGDSPSLPRRDLEAARALAAGLGVRLEVLATDEMSDSQFTANPPNRCYLCKGHLFRDVWALAQREGFTAVLDGNNADDTGDFRPGRKAAAELGVRSPLLEAGLTKAEIRAFSRELGLPTADKPAAACLASRLPYGTRITAEKLQRIEQGEDWLHDHGFVHVRVRDHDELARLEVPPADIPRFADAELRAAVVKQLKALGYRYVTLDLQGYRIGSMNEVL